MVAATTAKPNTASRNGMAKKDKDKAPAKKGDKGAADKSVKKTPADLMLEASSELRNTVAAIEKQYGEGSIMPLGADKVRRIEGIPTGSLSVGEVALRLGYAEASSFIHAHKRWFGRTPAARA